MGVLVATYGAIWNQIMASFTKPDNCASWNSAGEEESFSMWSLQRGGLMELESDQDSSASPIL